MGYKATDETLAKVGDDEPIFVLRAQDALAPETLQYWISRAEIRGVPKMKTDEAYELKSKLIAWQIQNADKVKVPD